MNVISFHIISPHLDMFPDPNQPPSPPPPGWGAAETCRESSSQLLHQEELLFWIIYVETADRSRAGSRPQPDTPPLSPLLSLLSSSFLLLFWFTGSSRVSMKGRDTGYKSLGRRELQQVQSWGDLENEGRERESEKEGETEIEGGREKDKWWFLEAHVSDLFLNGV